MLKILYAGCFGLSPAISSQFGVEMCTAAKNCTKNHQNPSFAGSRSFKVIDVDKSKKPVTSACYGVHQVCTYLQPFSRYNSQQRQNNVFLSGVPFLDALVRGELFHPGARNFVTIN